MNTSFDWRLIRSFLAVFEAGSLLGAARALGAQQPTLGRHIAELEAQLGTPLFERTGRGLTPTAAAHAIAESARHMQDAADALALRVQERRATATGTVRLTTSTVAASYLLPPLIAQLRQAEPGIEIVLMASNQINNLLRREADIAVRMARPEQTSLIARKLADIPIIAAAHASYLERAGCPQVPADLAHHSLIGFEHDDTIEQALLAHGIVPTLAAARSRLAVRTDDHLAYGQLVAQGLGIGFIASYTQAHWPHIHRVLPQLPIPPLPCWLAVHREIRGSALVRRVYDFLAAAIPAAL